MKILFLFCFGSLISLAIQAQSSGPYKYLGNYTQPAPNVASLGKFVDYPVGYYTGTPQINIPIYDLQDGAAKTSISLSYHASGIRVAELASWVGLGWALNAGGMITRSVRGGPDEGVYNVQTACGGYYIDSGIRKMPLLPYPVNNLIPANNDEFYRERLRAAISNGQGDTEPDLFTFNFDGYGGKFVFDESKTPHLLTESDVRIEASLNGGTFNWIITSPEGVKYLFGFNNINEINEVYANTGPDNNSARPTSWLLTQIIYPNTKDTINFNYTAETYSYFDLGQETAIYDYTNNIRLACALTPRPSNVYKTTVTGYRLSTITTRNYKVIFGVNTGNIRQDLKNSGSNYPYSLDSIKIYNSQDQCLKQFVLAHQYFTSTNANNMYSPVASFVAGDETDTKRLKLTSVKEYSGDGAISKPPYTISYEESYQIPRRLSYDVDHWGFSNNYNGNNNQRFTPTVYHPLCLYVESAANRNPKWPDMQSYSIKNIKDPLGVLTSFEFEAHTTTMMENNMVGGLRIKKITTTDSVTGRSTVRGYSYPSPGVLYRVPQYLLAPENEFYFPMSTLVFGNYYKGYAGTNSDLRALIKQSQSVVPLQDFQGNHIGYPIVRETFGLNGEGGYKLYSFMADQLSRNNSRLHMSNYTASATIYPPAALIAGPMVGTYGNGHFNDIAPENLAYYDGYNVDNFYPAAPPQVDFRRGQLIREETYDSTGKKLQEVYNTYVQNYHENAWIRGFKFFRTIKVTGYSDPNSSWAASDIYNDAMTFYKLHTGISHLASTITTVFKDGKTMKSVTEYKYESPYHTQKTSDSTYNSTGDVIFNKTYYSFDYTNGATGDNIFGKMKTRNMVVPIATRTWKNNELINGTITLYKDFAISAPDTFINLHKIYTLEISSPLSTVQAGENVAFSTQFTTLLPNSYFKEKAIFNVDGSTGKVNEQKIINDKSQTVIWDNKLSFPMAVVDNAINSDAAYSSFETSQTGNWTYSAGSIVSESTAPTGIKGYTLSGNIYKSGLTSSQKYILSYWLKSGASASISGGTLSNSLSGRSLNGWTYKQVTISGATGITISGSGSIDEVRLHPFNAQMTTYTYDNLLRLSAQCSPNNTISYYEYDSMNRLTDIKDQYGNVIKSIEYNYGRSSRPGQ
jgi:hypothetical protein